MAITVADKAKWEKAIAKCKTEKPRVRKLEEFGKFEVTGSKGDSYTVAWTGKGQEMKAECNCKAGQKSAPCYHVPATSGAFKLQVQERVQARHICPECTQVEVAVAGRLCSECAEKISAELFG